MNFFDIVFSVVTLGFVLLSFTRGSLRELLSTLGIVLGYFGAEGFHERYLSLTLQYVNDYGQAKIITYLAIFAAGIVAGTLLSAAIKILLAAQRPNMSSRILGGMLGFIKGLLVCLVIFFIVEGYVPSYVDDLYNSFFTPWLQDIRNIVNGINLA